MNKTGVTHSAQPKAAAAAVATRKPRESKDCQQRAKLPEVVDQPAAFVEPAERQLDGKVERHRIRVAVGQLRVEAPAAFEVRRHHDRQGVGRGTRWSLVKVNTRPRRGSRCSPNALPEHRQQTWRRGCWIAPHATQR